jgi:hypothetical protein
VAPVPLVPPFAVAINVDDVLFPFIKSTYVAVPLTPFPPETPAAEITPAEPPIPTFT